MEKNFYDNNAFSLVVGMFEKCGSTEKVAVNFCNSLLGGGKKTYADAGKIITDYNERVHGDALCCAIAYLSVFYIDKLYRLADDAYLGCWMAVFVWYRKNGSSFRCLIDGVESRPMNKCIGKLLECGELYLEQDKEFGCLNICLNPNNEIVDTSRAVAIYNSLMTKTDFLGYAYNNTITMEEASRVIGSEICKGNMDLIEAV